MTGGLRLPPGGGGISDDVVAFAAELAGRSGKAPVIEAALAHRTGRPRPLPVRAVLTALLCLALEDRPLFLTEATRLLFRRLSGTSGTLLAVTGTASGRRGFLAAYRRVRYCFGAICSVMDPSALPKNRRLTADDLAKRTKPMTAAQIAGARGRLEAFLNSLLEASLSVLDQEESAAYDGATGLDATPVPLFSRGPSKRTGLSASDPDGGWYVREGDHRDHQDDKGKPLRKIAWALEATIATTARPPGAPPATPDLAAGLAVTRPGEDPGGTGARVLASVAARGHKDRVARLRPRLHPGPARAVPPSRPRAGLPAGHGLPRRPARHPGKHQRSITRRGHLVLPRPARAADHRHHPAARPRHHPRPLRPADRRPRLLPAQAQRRARRRRIPAPVVPRHRPPPRADLPAPRRLAVTTRRPAQGPAATARTAQALPPDRHHHRARHRRPLRQDLPYAGPAWHARYATLRNTIEGFNGYVKDTAHEALAQPARRRVRGIAAQSIFTALLLIAANIRKIRAWRALTAGEKDTITRRARRRRSSLRDYLPDG